MPLQTPPARSPGVTPPTWPSARLSVAVPGARLEVDAGADLVCVSVSAPAGTRTVLAALAVTARSCALGGGR